MSVEAKICGLSTPETVDAAVAGRRALGGLRHLPALAAPRRVEDVLKALGARVPKSVGRVGLFVDPDDALLDERLATGASTCCSSMAAETPERVAAIKAAHRQAGDEGDQGRRGGRRRARHRGLCRASPTG